MAHSTERRTDDHISNAVVYMCAHLMPALASAFCCRRRWNRFFGFFRFFAGTASDSFGTTKFNNMALDTVFATTKLARPYMQKLAGDGVYRLYRLVLCAKTRWPTVARDFSASYFLKINYEYYTSIVALGLFRSPCAARPRSLCAISVSSRRNAITSLNMGDKKAAPIPKKVIIDTGEVRMHAHTNCEVYRTQGSCVYAYRLYTM